MKFAALLGIKYQTFANWAQKRRRGAVSSRSGMTEKDRLVRWLEAGVQQAQGLTAQSGTLLKLLLPGGASVEIGHSNQVHWLRCHYMWWNDWLAHVEFFRQSESVRGGGGVRYALLRRTSMMD